MKYMSASIISASTKSRIVGRCSMTVTLMERAVTIDAYSRPMTPAPATMRSRGICVPSRSWSESMMRLPSSGTVVLCAGRVPHAIRMWSARRNVGASAEATSIVWGSVKRAEPCTVATWLRASCARTTSISLTRTFCTRKARSATVISLLTA